MAPLGVRSVGRANTTSSSPSDTGRSGMPSRRNGVRRSVDRPARPVPPTSAPTFSDAGSCGLEWFDPASPGGSAFYAELMGAMPYNADRWEFGMARAEIRPDDDVLDLGCGEGAFLRSLGYRSGRTVGVDLNVPAVDALRAIGIEAHVGDFGDLSARPVGLFDVVSAFHLLEHVADPRRRRPCSRALPQAGRANDRLRSQSGAIVEERA